MHFLCLGERLNDVFSTKLKQCPPINIVDVKYFNRCNHRNICRLYQHFLHYIDYEASSISTLPWSHIAHSLFPKHTVCSISCHRRRDSAQQQENDRFIRSAYTIILWASAWRKLVDEKNRKVWWRSSDIYG